MRAAGPRIAIAGIALAALVALDACTIYGTCIDEYGDTRQMGVPLAEACSRGVTFRTKSSRYWAERHCNGNYYSDETRDACFRGIWLAERGRQGIVYRDGLDD